MSNSQDIGWGDIDCRFSVEHRRPGLRKEAPGQALVGGYRHIRKPARSVPSAQGRHSRGSAINVADYVPQPIWTLAGEGQSMASWSDGYWSSSDGLRLHYRDYAGSATRPPILCIPGLTRNARDFDGVAERLAGEWRVICVELRGRGESGYAKDPATYVPRTYVADVEALIAELKLDRFVLFGTSLGGLVTMLLAASEATRIAGAMINDIGPVIDARGLERIRGYVGRSQSWPTWLHAARFFAEAQGDRYPGWKLDQWLIFAKRLCKLNPSGRIVLDYDMRIAEPFKASGGATGSDLWPAFGALAGIPSLVVHGGISDLLTADTVAAMKASNPALESVTVPNVGHAPTLDESEAVEAIDRLLAKIEGEGK
jgi:pimeloyl-ACP methyl ester carboxylesterase